MTSEATGERLAADFGVDQDRIKVVVPGTDDAPRSIGSGGPGCNILSIGTLVPRKGHDVLLRALARLFDLDWQLTIVGSPERDPVYARSLVALVEELGITRPVRFAGEVVGDALEALWQRADVFALATHWEGYGMAIAEALKRGVPVAVTDGGAAGRLVTPEAGVVCPVGDRVNLSKALRRLIFGAALRREWRRPPGRSGRRCRVGTCRCGNSRRPWLGERTLRRRLAGVARAVRSCRAKRRIWRGDWRSGCRRGLG